MVREPVLDRLIQRLHRLWKIRLKPVAGRLPVPARALGCGRVAKRLHKEPVELQPCRSAKISRHLERRRESFLRPFIAVAERSATSRTGMRSGSARIES